MKRDQQQQQKKQKKWDGKEKTSINQSFEKHSHPQKQTNNPNNVFGTFNLYTINKFFFQFVDTNKQTKKKEVSTRVSKKLELVLGSNKKVLRHGFISFRQCKCVPDKL